MDPKDVFNASLMLTFLKKEELFYKNALMKMEQDYIRLQIEELALKAAIRQELMNAVTKVKDEVKSPPKPSTSSENTQQALTNPEHKGIDDTVQSNITDDRYLEPLILNPRAFNENELVEFDD